MIGPEFEGLSVSDSWANKRVFSSGKRSKGSIQSRVELRKAIIEAYEFLNQPDEEYQPQDSNAFNLTNQKYDAYELEKKEQDLPKMETVEEFVKKRIDGCLNNKKIDNNSFYSRYFQIINTVLGI